MKLIVTAGPTREYLDPVRFLSNPSTGKMGFAIARAAAAAGFEVTLVAGPVALKTPRGVKRINVVSARDMLTACQRCIDRGEKTVLVSTAAIADWRPAKCAKAKLKKHEMSDTLKLVRNPDLLRTIKGVLKIGFAAETGELAKEASRKCREKGLEFIVANDVTKRGCGFGTDTNEATIFRRDGSRLALPMMSKLSLARRIVKEISALGR